ncbi:MAG: recombination protein RecR, partial [Elusimicrobia bacterium]|nr:recombination protein RecR [Elusimicrobiota bacterium]
MRAWGRLIASLKRLPGIGPKQAERLAQHLIRTKTEEVDEL